MSNILDRAVSAMFSGQSIERWLEAEERRSIAERQKRLRRELNRAVKVEGQIFTVLEIKRSPVPQFKAQLDLRHWVNRRRATVLVREDGSFGVLNWK